MVTVASTPDNLPVNTKIVGKTENFGEATRSRLVVRESWLQTTPLPTNDYPLNMYVYTRRMNVQYKDSTGTEVRRIAG